MWLRNQNILYLFVGFFLNNNIDKMKIKYYFFEYIIEYLYCVLKSFFCDNKLVYLWGKLIYKYVINLI